MHPSIRGAFVLFSLVPILAANPALSAWDAEPTFVVDSVKGSIVIADVARDRFLSLNAPGDPFSYPVPRYSVFAIPMNAPTGWEPLAVEGSPPPKMAAPLDAMDPGRDRILLVDDFDPLQPGSEVYALDLSPAPVWHRLTPAGTPPVARMKASLTYDPLGDRLLLFGGTIGLGPTNELWELRFSPNLEWRKVDTAGLVPPALENPPMTFDAPHQRLVVVQPPSDSPLPGTPALAWTLDVSGELPAWDVQVPTGQQPPPGSFGTQTVRDSTRNLLIIEAKPQNAYPQVDSWGLRLTPQLDWLQFGPVAAFRPSASMGVLAFDERRTRLFSFWTGSYAVRFGYLDPVPGYTDVVIPGATFSSGTPASIAFDPGARSAIVQTNNGSMRLVRYSGGWAWEKQIPLGHGPFTLVGSSWDTRAHRVLRFEYNQYQSPSVLAYTIDPDSTKPWAPLTAPNGPGARQEAAVAYDSTTGTTYLFGGGKTLGDLWSLRLVGGAGVWTRVSAGGGPTGYGSAMILDPVRQRLVVFGGASGNSANAQLWTYSLVTNTWGGLFAQGTGPAARVGAAAVYDPIGDRLLIAGGRNNSIGYVDAFALPLGTANPTWVSLGSFPMPAPTLGFFDETDNKLVLIDDLLPVLSFDAAPSLTVNAPASIPGAPAGTVTIPVGLHEKGLGSVRTEYEITSERAWPGLPRTGSLQVVSVPNTTIDLEVAVPDSAAQGTNHLHVIVTALDGSGVTDTATVAIDVSAIPSPVLACGSDVTWTPGTKALLAYVVDNASPAAGPITYRLTVDRAWPGLPIEGEADLPAYGSKLLPFLVPVPDTVAAGAVVAHLVVAPAARPNATDECFRHLHDPTTPTLLSVIESDVAPDGSSVRLTWWSQSAAYSEVTIERRAEVGAFAAISTAQGDASGLIVFEDREVPGPGRYAYRAGREGEWSLAFWVDVPATPLAFVKGSNIRNGSLDVEFTVPSSTPVTIEAYDVRGRRVASRRIDQVSAGRNLVRLASPNTAASGVYFVRLTQGEKRVTGRIILLRDAS